MTLASHPSLGGIVFMKICYFLANAIFVRKQRCLYEVIDDD